MSACSLCLLSYVCLPRVCKSLCLLCSNRFPSYVCLLYYLHLQSSASMDGYPLCSLCLSRSGCLLYMCLVSSGCQLCSSCLLSSVCVCCVHRVIYIRRGGRREEASPTPQLPPPQTIKLPPASSVHSIIYYEEVLH